MIVWNINTQAVNKSYDPKVLLIYNWSTLLKQYSWAID